MLEITREDIAALTDAALSGLVERLCEAELIKAGCSTAGLTLGGAQDASDGGVDLAVDTDDRIADCGYIPRARTIFQVKATPMPPAKVVDEMRPKPRGAPEGSLRPVIAEVLGQGGAYVIVCSKTAPAGANLTALRERMAAAAAPAMSATAAVDFIGPDRLALWCRSHPGVLSWARQAAGRPLQGWSPFENWSKPAEGAEPVFIIDEEARLIDERGLQEGPIPVIDGLERMRALVASPSAAVRLVGLSGVGKTRLVQALFDDRLGDGALPQPWALYCDAGGAVSPDPVEMAKQLTQRSDRVILVVDNCSPQLHRSLVSVIEAATSPVSLVSVEYDVRDDDMEGTEVFRLEPASELVTDRLIKRRYPHIRSTDRRRIADMAGGNARIALAIAHTVRRSDTLGQLRDDELFDRLFYQRARTDGELVSAAEVAALVYSFDGEALDGELVALASLAEQTVTRFRGGMGELARRDLLQSRSQWRAVLPHAVANRLAVRALERLDPETIATALDGRGERLLRSFSRRLSFLHDAPAARRLAEAWFHPGGRLGDLRGLGAFSFDMFRNLAPLAPKAALAAISRAAALDPTWKDFEPGYGRRQNRGQLIELLRALAFDAELFDEAAERLAELDFSDEDSRPKPTRPVLDALFKLHGSGTMSPPGQRLGFAMALVASDAPQRSALGLGLLDAMLETEWFRHAEGLDFGARPRGSGWEPTGDEATRLWYAPVLAAVTELASSPGPHLEAGRSILAKRLRGLWWATGLEVELAASAAAVAQHRFWPEGWIATRMGMKFAPKAAETAALAALEARLRPVTLVEKVRTYGGVTRMTVDIEDADDLDDETPGRRSETYTRGLGAALAGDPATRSAVLPELLDAGVQRPYFFGEGLAQAASDRRALWLELVAALRARPRESAEPALLRAYLRAWNEIEPGVAEPLLDDILHDPLLGRWLPFMQTALPALDAAGIARLKASFTLGHTALFSYQVLMFGGTLDALSPEDYAEILTSITAIPGGKVMALHFFHQRTFSEKKKQGLAEPILAAGRALLYDFPLDDLQGRQDAHLGDLAELCLPGLHADLALRTLRRLRIAVDRYGASTHVHDQLIAAIVEHHPQTALDFFLGAPQPRRRRRGSRRLLERLGIGRRPLASLTTESLLAWVRKEPGVRHARVAGHIPLFVGRDDDDVDQWWPPALALLDDAPDPAPVLAAFGDNLSPNSWSGSLAEILERRIKALKRFDSHPSQIVRSWASTRQSELAERAAGDRKRARHRYQAFE